MNTLGKKLAGKLGLAVTLVAMILVVLGVAVLARIDNTSFSMLTGDGITYPSATVLQVVAEDLEHEEGTSRYLGSQTLKVRIETGAYAGEEVDVENSLSATHVVMVNVGDRIVIKCERQEGITPYYSVFNYDRTPGLLAIGGIFTLCMLLVGGTKGLRSLIGLAFALYMVVCFLLPAIFSGISPIVSGLICSLIIAIFSMLLLNGWTKKTAAAILSTAGGLIAAVVVYVVFAALIHVDGYNQESAEELILIQQNTGLVVQDILFVGVLVSSLGAVMDMCMSIAASLFEIQEQNPLIDMRSLVKSGFSIGKDMIGTMCQTLILAFTGTSLASLLVLMAYGIEINQLLSSDYLAVEFIHSFVGGVAVILCVPITSVVCAVFARKEGSVKEKKDSRCRCIK